MHPQRFTEPDQPGRFPDPPVGDPAGDRLMPGRLAEPGRFFWPAAAGPEDSGTAAINAATATAAATGGIARRFLMQNMGSSPLG